MQTLHRIVFLFFLYISTASTATFFDFFEANKSYQFALLEQGEVAKGLLQRNKTSYYWATEDSADPDLWLSTSQATILDESLKIATIWSLDDFQELHPFIGAWLWLTSIENEVFTEKQGSYAFCHKQKGCFELDWSPSIRKMAWNAGQVVLTIQTSKGVKGSQFNFKLPQSWDIEEN